MAFEAQEFGRSVAAPGLVFPDQPYKVLSKVMKESVESEGGFPIFAVKGDDNGAYATKPTASEGVKRTLTVTIGGTVATGDKFSVTIGTSKYETTVGSTETATAAATALATAITDGNFDATASNGVITLEAKQKGASYNDIVVTADKESTSGTITVQATESQTPGADVAEDGIFVGIAQRIVTRDEYPAGTAVSVVTEGHIWVKAGGDVKSGDGVALNADGEWVAADGEDATQTAVNGSFLTSASSGAYAVVELK